MKRLFRSIVTKNILLFLAILLVATEGQSRVSAACNPRGSIRGGPPTINP